MDPKFVGEDDSLVTVTDRRVPVCLCLDTSGSMYDCIGELNEAVGLFYQEILKDEQAANSADIAIVTFDSNVRVAEEFSDVSQKEKPHFTAGGGTDMAGGIRKALEILDARKEQYKQYGRDYFQPWLVIMSDGEPNDANAIPFAEIQQRVESKKLVVFCFGIGNGADMELLRRISPKTMKIKDGAFNRFFEWLSKSVVRVSQSQPGDKITLPQENLDTIFDLDVN